MKQKKVDWFTKNSTLLFIVSLFLEILFVNLFLHELKYLRIYFARSAQINWTTLLAILITFALCVAILLFLAFIIYYEDYKQSNNKRSFKLFEVIIEKFFKKGANE
jgi:Na+/proline symporter